MMHNHILPILGDLFLKEITPLKVQDFLLKLQEKGISPPTIGKVYRVLKAILRRAVALELITRDPTIGVSPPWVERKEMRFLAPEEVSSLLEATEWTDIGDVAALAVMTGLRQGEILALQWGKRGYSGAQGKHYPLLAQGLRPDRPQVRLFQAEGPHPGKTRPRPGGRERAPGLSSPGIPGLPLRVGTFKDRRNLITREFDPVL